MRFHLGAIPESPDFHPEEEGWQSLREPSPLVFQLWALPVAILNVVVLAILWKALVPSLPIKNGALAGIGVLIVLLSFILVHEIIHAVTAPGWGLSNHTLIGAWPQKFVFYAHYDGAMSRNRFILVFAMPFLLLSVVPILIAAFAARLTQDGTIPVILQFLVFINGLCACGDILGIAMFARQIPASAQVRNQGWRTFWKMEEGSEVVCRLPVCRLPVCRLPVCRLPVAGVPVMLDDLI